MELNSQLDRLLKYEAIEKELKNAKEKHPEFPDDVFKQLAIMQEEAGEVTKAVLQYRYENGSLDDIRKELIQTAAMCVRMLEYIGFQLPHPTGFGCHTATSKDCRSFTVDDLEILSGTISIPSLTIDLVDMDFAADIEHKLEDKGYSIDYVSLDDMGHISVGYYGNPYPVTITDKHIEDLLSVLNDR